MSNLALRSSGQSLAGGAVTVFQPMAIAENIPLVSLSESTLKQ